MSLAVKLNEFLNTEDKEEDPSWGHLGFTHIPDHPKSLFVNMELPNFI